MKNRNSTRKNKKQNYSGGFISKKKEVKPTAAVAKASNAKELNARSEAARAKAEAEKKIKLTKKNIIIKKPTAVIVETKKPVSSKQKTQPVKAKKTSSVVTSTHSNSLKKNPLQLMIEHSEKKEKERQELLEKLKKNINSPNKNPMKLMMKELPFDDITNPHEFEKVLGNNERKSKTIKEQNVLKDKIIEKDIIKILENLSESPNKTFDSKDEDDEDEKFNKLLKEIIDNQNKVTKGGKSKKSFRKTKKSKK